MKIAYLIASILAFWLGAEYLLSIKPETTSMEYANWALAFMALNIAPGIHYLIFRRKNIPLIPLVGFFYILEFSLPVFYIDIRFYQFGVLDIRTLQFAFYGLLLFYISYYFSFFSLKSLRSYAPIALAYKDNIKLITLLMWAFFGLGLVGKFVHISALRHFTDPAAYIATGLFLYLFIKKKIHKTVAIGLLLYILFEFVQKLTAYGVAHSMRYALYLGIIYYLITRKIPWPAVATVVILVALMLPVKLEYRKFLADSTTELTITEKLEAYYALAYEHYLGREGIASSEVGGNDEGSPLFRFSYSASAFSVVIVNTPGIVPYWDGVTYSTLFSKFIPRFLWPNKPVEDIGNEFGHRYGLLHESDEGTSMNLPWLAELYANYGESAVYYGMALFGLMYGFIDRFYNSGKSVVNVILSAAIYFPILQHESNFALLAGNIFLLSVAIYMFTKFIIANLSLKRSTR